MFYLAHICHLSPSEVGRLRVSDFMSLVLGIDAYLEGIKNHGPF